MKGPGPLDVSLGIQAMSAKHANWTLIITIAIALLGWAFGGYGTYAADARDMTNRLSVVETHQGDADKRLERLEQKIDRILERVNR
jgi:hypothetical protein